MPREGVGVQIHLSAELKREGDPFSCPGPQRGLGVGGQRGGGFSIAPPLLPPPHVFAFQGSQGQPGRGKLRAGRPRGARGLVRVYFNFTPF